MDGLQKYEEENKKLKSENDDVKATPCIWWIVNSFTTLTPFLSFVYQLREQLSMREAMEKTETELVASLSLSDTILRERVKELEDVVKELEGEKEREAQILAGKQVGGRLFLH